MTVLPNWGAKAPRWLGVAGLVAVVVVSWSRHTRAVLTEARSDPGWRLARAVAGFAESRLGATGRIAVAAPAVPSSSIEDYVRKVRHAGGDVERARETARLFARLPPDGVRVAAHLGRRAGTVVPHLEPAALVAVFDGASAAAGPVVARFDAPPRHVVVHQAPAHVPAAH